MSAVDSMLQRLDREGQRIGWGIGFTIYLLGEDRYLVWEPHHRIEGERFRIDPLPFAQWSHDHYLAAADFKQAEFQAGRG